MKTEIFEYFKKLSQRENVSINIANTFLGLFIIVTGLLGLIPSMTMIAYALMFIAGFGMFGLNYYKKRKSDNKNRYFYLVAGIASAIFACLFIYGLVR